MKKLVIQSLKGGVGKTTVVAQLGYALHRKGFHVALLDLDITAPKLHKALGFGGAPKWKLDSAKEAIFPARADGIQFLTVAGHTKEKSTILLDEKQKIEVAKELLSDEVVWDNPDWLLIDTPPSSSGEMEALFEALPDLYGILLVFQPTQMAEADLIRTVDFIQYKQLPILGVVSNMDSCISPQGERFWQFLSPRIDIDSICASLRVPLLAVLPQADLVKLAPLFDDLIRNMELAKPETFKPGKLEKVLKKMENEALKEGVSLLRK